jgi:hypothetical protein
LHGRDRQQREKKRLEKLTPKIEALYAKAELLLAADRDVFAIPIQTRLTFPSGELKTWIKLVTPTVRQAIADANEFIQRTNHTITQHLTARHDPLTVNEQVNELRPVSRMIPHSTPNNTTYNFSFPVATHSGLPIVLSPPIQVYHRCRFPEGE